MRETGVGVYSAGALRRLRCPPTLHATRTSRNWLITNTKSHGAIDDGVRSSSNASAGAMSAYGTCHSDITQSTAPKLLNYSRCILVRKYRQVNHDPSGISQMVSGHLAIPTYRSPDQPPEASHPPEDG